MGTFVESVEPREEQERKKALEEAKIIRGVLSHPIIQLSSKQRRYLRIKRVLDIVISLAALLLLAVPMLCIAVLKMLLDRGEPVIFSQIRIGQYGKSFRIFKFRTMKSSAPSSLPTGEVPEDYITPFGKWLRKFSLDELPQLVNVLIGEMSIVGPRPLLWNENEIRYLRKFYGIYHVKPGITGWAQINGRDKVGVIEKVQLDREYVENVSFRFDCRIFFQTILCVVRQKDIIEGVQHAAET